MRSILLETSPLADDWGVREGALERRHAAHMVGDQAASFDQQVDTLIAYWRREQADVSYRMPDDALHLIAKELKQSPDGDADRIRQKLVTIAARAKLAYANTDLLNAPPWTWNSVQTWWFDVTQVPTVSCRHCHKKGARVILHAESDCDDYRVWRIFTWECNQCGRAWDMRSDRVAPDWSARVN